MTPPRTPPLTTLAGPQARPAESSAAPVTYSRQLLVIVLASLTFLIVFAFAVGEVLGGH
jgi:hypothetical protein